MTKFRAKILSATITICLASSSVLPVMAATKSEVKQKIEQNQSDLNSVNGLIGNLTTEKANIEAQIEELDMQFNELFTKLTELTTQMDTKQSEIDTTKANLEVAKEEEAQQYEDMKKRIRFMYENGNGALIEVLLQADSITDLLNKAEYVSKISEYDRDMLTKYQATKDSIAALETQLVQEYADLEAVKADVSAKQAEVEANIETKNVEIANYEANISEAEREAIAYANEIAEDNMILAQIEEEERIAAEKAAAEKAAAEKAAAEAAAKAASEAAAQKAASEQASSKSNTTNNAPASTPNAPANNTPAATPNNSSAGFIWPCPSSHNITCGYGQRSAPTEGASTNHQAIDISANAGAAILAAAGGTVTTAGYSTGTGNYIIINHGNGFSTIYMHASALYVSAGQTVSQGTTIAAVGSTGYSTGNHLHFGIMLNGSYVNPLNYL